MDPPFAKHRIGFLSLDLRLCARFETLSAHHFFHELSTWFKSLRLLHIAGGLVTGAAGFSTHQ